MYGCFETNKEKVIIYMEYRRYKEAIIFFILFE